MEFSMHSENFQENILINICVSPLWT